MSMNIKEMLSDLNIESECEVLTMCNLIEKKEISVDDFAQTVIRLYEEGILKDFAQKILGIYYNLPIDTSLAIADLVPAHIRNDSGIWQ